MSTTDRKRSMVGDARFPKVVRLRTARDFKAVYTGGKKSVTRSFVVFILPNAREVTRFGLTTPRKLGRAHERNRIRRRLREILRVERRAFPIGFDVVLNPRRSVLERNFETLRMELAACFRTIS